MKGSERRKHVRQPIRLDARISGDGQGSLACQIRDFCVDGLFIAVPGLNGNDAVTLNERELALDDLVQVHFSLDAGDGPAEFEASVRVAGNFKGGIGVQFRESDPRIIRALKALTRQQAEARPRQPAAEPAYRAPSGAVPEKLKERFRDLLSVFLQTEIDAMFEAADETLFQGARDAGSDQGEKAFLEAQQEAGKLKPPLSKAFIDNVMFGLGHLGEGPIEPIQGQQELGDDDDAGLSLVDTMNFGDILRVKQILGRCERRFKDSEYDLEVRLSNLFRVVVDQDSDPVGVRAVCFAFHDAIQNLGATRLARGSVFDAFEHTLIGKLADLQESFADAFEEAGVWPTSGPGQSMRWLRIISWRAPSYRPVIRSKCVTQVRAKRCCTLCFGRISVVPTWSLAAITPGSATTTGRWMRTTSSTPWTLDASRPSR